MLNKPLSRSLFLGLSIATGTQYITAQEITEELNTTQTIKVEIVADTIPANESLGKTIISEQNIKELNTGNSTINDIAYTMPNVQFLDSYNELSEDSILDIRPSNISISGGEYYENNFIVDGMRTNTLHDTSNQNIHNMDKLVGHSQTVFVNPAMVESVTIYDSNVPAKYSYFTGGVFEVETKDPSGEFHTGTMFGFETDDMTNYILVAPEDYNPETDEEVKPEFTKYQFSAYVDTPITENTAVLFEYSRQLSDLENERPYAIYGDEPLPTHSRTDDYKVKTKTELNNGDTLVFNSIYSVSEKHSVVQSERIQKNHAWQNSVEYEHQTENSSLDILIGYQISDMGREQEPIYYTYAKTDSITWGTSSSSAGYGGWGDLDAEEKQLPIMVDYTYLFSDTAKVNLGAEYAYEYANTERPEDFIGYTRTLVSNLVVSAEGVDDPTVIDGEQAFTQRMIYDAYSAEASINNFGTWAEFSNEHTIAGTKFSYRLGARFDYEDYLENANLAPRLVATWTPQEWVDITVGWNRYYSGSYLGYALRENNPDMILERRSYTIVDGQYVFSSDDWYTYLVSSTTKYSQADVDTPYNDEFTIATTLHSKLGDLKLQYLDRKGRDKFARSPRETIELDDGTTYRTYFITNNGYSDYESFSFKWTYQWENHQFEVNGTSSEIKSTNYDPLEEFTEDELLEEVYYNDEIITFGELSQEREGYGSPDYFNMKWTSHWLKNRLSFTLSGRLELAYDSIRLNGNITVDGTRYSFYEDYRVSDRLTMNLNTTWVAYDSTDFGTVKLYLKLRNIFNDNNDSGDIYDYAYYEEGRSLWAGVSYDF